MGENILIKAGGGERIASNTTEIYLWPIIAKN